MFPYFLGGSYLREFGYNWAMLLGVWLPRSYLRWCLAAESNAGATTAKCNDA